MNEIKTIITKRPLTLEKAELERCKSLGIKPKPFTKEQISQIIAEGTGMVSHHIGMYQEEFVRFFRSNPHSIVGFDVEEMIGNLASTCKKNGDEDRSAKRTQLSICIMGLKISPDLKTSVIPITLRGPPSISQNSGFETKIMGWLGKQKPSAQICIHGSNVTENRILQQLSQPKINTQGILSQAIKEKIGQCPTSTGLDAFEKAIGFQRDFCGFMKDSRLELEGIDKKKLVFLFNRQSISSLSLRRNKMNRRTCLICGRTQDVLMYCLEDVFVTLLIYVYYSNRGIRMNSKPQEASQ